MSTRTYTIILEPDVEEGGYSVLVPALPGCQTQGETIEECVAMARDAIEGYILTLQDLGRPIPEETMHPLAITLDLTVPETAEVSRQGSGKDELGDQERPVGVRGSRPSVPDPSIGD